MPYHTLLLFVPACFAINMAFGPNNLLALTNGARHGVGLALVASMGRIVAFAAMIAIAALGMGALLATSELVFTVVKVAGAAYLAYLGLKLIRSHETLAADAAEGPKPRTTWGFARQEFLVAAGNPKAILVFTAFFPQFVTPGAYWQSFAIEGAIFLAFEVVAIAIYALIGARLLGAIRNSAAMRWVNRTSGAMMVGFGVALAFARRPAA